MYTSGSCKSDVVYGCTRPRRDNACRLAIRSPHLAGFRRINFPREGINSTFDFIGQEERVGILYNSFFLLSCDVSLRKELRYHFSSNRLNFSPAFYYYNISHNFTGQFIKKFATFSHQLHQPQCLSFSLSLLLADAQNNGRLLYARKDGTFF